MNFVKEARGHMGLTSEHVAQRAGISRSAYTNIENGKRRPSPEVAMKIGAVLGIDWKLFYEPAELAGVAEG